MSSRILSSQQVRALRAALQGRLLALCFGSGVDSTGMIVALHEAGIRPDVLTFANTGAEKRETIEHLHRMNSILAAWGWPLIQICTKQTLPNTGYVDLYGNCMKNETLPSLAFGMKSCSMKWKQAPQDQFLKGVMRGPNKRAAHPLWLQSRAEGRKIAKMIGYDVGAADLRRSKDLACGDADFDYLYPLQIIGWSRADCVAAISDTLGEDFVPVKSACYFCPATKQWELFWLAAVHPELLEAALVMERRALTGKHSRFDAVEFGATWEELVRTSDRFPSTSTTVGLGRGFAWNQWARVNDVVDENYNVIRAEFAKHRFLAMSAALRGSDNALDVRSSGRKEIPIRLVP